MTVIDVEIVHPFVHGSAACSMRKEITQRIGGIFFLGTAHPPSGFVTFSLFEIAPRPCRRTSPSDFLAEPIQAGPFEAGKHRTSQVTLNPFATSLPHKVRQV